MQVSRAPRLLLIFSDGDLGQGGAFICRGGSGGGEWGGAGLTADWWRDPQLAVFSLGFHATARPCSELAGVTQRTAPAGLAGLCQRRQLRKHVEPKRGFDNINSDARDCREPLDILP